MRIRGRNPNVENTDAVKASNVRRSCRAFDIESRQVVDTLTLSLARGRATTAAAAAYAFRSPWEPGRAIVCRDRVAAGDYDSRGIDCSRDCLGTRLVGESEDLGKAREDLLPDGRQDGAPASQWKVRPLSRDAEISRSIVENHGGKLWGSLKDGPGATLQFALLAYEKVSTARLNYGRHFDNTDD